MIPWAAIVDAISWIIWNPMMGALCGVFFGRAVAATIKDILL